MTSTPLPEELFPELKDILRQALQQSPQMVLKNIELAQSEAARMTAFAQMLPTVLAGWAATTWGLHTVFPWFVGVVAVACLGAATLGQSAGAFACSPGWFAVRRPRD